MKIKTITCHNVYNYGASLQAYALQKYLEDLGNDVEIIDFRPWFHRKRYNLFYIDYNSSMYRIVRIFPFLKYLLAPIKNRSSLKTYGRKKSFDEFTDKELKITTTCYHTSEELKKNPPAADLYIAGSDQIWNTDTYNGKEDAYYLDFGTSDINRASYAASFAITSLPDSLKSYVRNRLLKFRNISVREKSGLKILKDLGINEGVHVLDPVFLLTSKQWKILSEQSVNTNNIYGKYILLYDFIGDKKIEEFTRMYAESMRIPIVSLNDYNERKYANINLSNCGPYDFLNLILNSDVIITNSFHATAFSIIFNKNFYSFPLITQRSSARMYDMLEMLQVLDRFDCNSIQSNNINYDRVNNRLNHYIDASKAYIDAVLNSI